MKYLASFVLLLSLVSLSAWAEEESPSYGSKAAKKYFKQRKPNSGAESRSKATAKAPSSAPRYLSLHLGGFVSDDSFRIGRREKEEDVGRVNAGVTYRIGEWKESMDMMFRADIISYTVSNGKPVKLSLMPLIAFPDARSEFPLYFGAGLGLGVYLKNVAGEEDLSLDYQLVAGGRFFNVWDSIGLMFELGMKNHINLLSDGQFNGVFASAGTVFSF